MTRILVTGIHGQVGFELLRACQPLGEVVGLDRQTLDLTDSQAIRRVLREAKPDVILNPAAYTAVDQAEQDERSATAINGDAVAVMAEEVARLNALFVHYSTDYVFDGSKGGAYTETDTPNPQSAYGRSKLAGEQALQASKADWLCLRTSWVYAARGKNFLRTILRLAAEREELRIVADQVGAPTSARLIAEATAQALRTAQQERSGGRFTSSILHLSASGATTWHDFATQIVDHYRASHPDRPLAVRAIHPITTADYPLPARRPACSRLDNTAFQQRFSLHLPDWAVGMRLCLAELG